MSQVFIDCLHSLYKPTGKFFASYFFSDTYNTYAFILEKWEKSGNQVKLKNKKKNSDTYIICMLLNEIVYW